MLLTAHKVVDHRINGTVRIAQPMREERQNCNDIALADFNGVSLNKKR